MGTSSDSVATAQAAEPPVDAGGSNEDRQASRGFASTEVFLGGGYLTNGQEQGLAVQAGLRLALGVHLAIEFDIGYGVLGSDREVQDRWWLFPAVVCVLPIDFSSFELGGSVGLAASSGYSNLDEFAAAPFDPNWALQLVPAMRGHMAWRTRLDRKLTFVARVDITTLLPYENTIGVRHGNPNPSHRDNISTHVSFGLSFRT